MYKKLNFTIDDNLIKKITFLTKFIKIQRRELYGDPSDEGYKSETVDDELVIDYYRNNKFSSFIHYSFPLICFINSLPISFRKKETPKINWQIISGGSSLPAHVDLQRKCAINFYLECNNETTIFYNRKRPGIFLKEINNKYTSNELFIPEWLEEVDRFVANKYDTYLIDTTVPHSVQSQTQQNRISISFSYYKTTFGELFKEVN